MTKTPALDFTLSAANLVIAVALVVHYDHPLPALVPAFLAGALFHIGLCEWRDLVLERLDKKSD